MPVFNTSIIPSNPTATDKKTVISRPAEFPVNFGSNLGNQNNGNITAAANSFGIYHEIPVIDGYHLTYISVSTHLEFVDDLNAYETTVSKALNNYKLTVKLTIPDPPGLSELAYDAPLGIIHSGGSLYENIGSGFHIDGGSEDYFIKPTHIGLAGYCQKENFTPYQLVQTRTFLYLAYTEN